MMEWVGGTQEREARAVTASEAEGQQKPETYAGPEFLFLSGPEGGLSETEERSALAQGWAAVTLGRRVLRADTAPLAALSIIAGVFEA